MQVFLSSHPAVSFLPEINLIRRFVLNGELNQVHGQEGEGKTLELLTADPKLKRLPYSWQELLPEETTEDFGESLFQNLVSRHCDSSSTYVGYKDALLIQSATEVLTRWGNSKIVHIYRDPRDVLASRKKADWSKDYPVWRNVIAGMIQLRIINQCRASGYADRIVDVKYEDLLAKPASVAENVCKFLRLDYDPDMLEFNRKAEDLVFSDELQWKKNLFSPILKGNSGKWKEQLTPHEIALVEGAYRNEMQELGYENSNAWGSLSLFEKLSVQCQLIWLRTVKKIYFLKKSVL